jgi:hypothetical protein
MYSQTCAFVPKDFPLTPPTSITAFQPAVALAEYRFAEKKNKEENERVILAGKDFEEVCEMSASFKEYLTSITGTNGAEWARTDGARDDYFDDKGPREI